MSASWFGSNWWLEQIQGSNHPSMPTFGCKSTHSRDPITETENGFMEPKYLMFRRWLYTPCSSFDLWWTRIPRARCKRPQSNNYDQVVKLWNVLFFEWFAFLHSRVLKQQPANFSQIHYIKYINILRNNNWGSLGYVWGSGQEVPWRWGWFWPWIIKLFV